MKTITRTEAIEMLRQKCAALVDDEHSLCEVATRMRILCGGFAQWTFSELKQRYDWIVRRRPHITRKELEDIANKWQLARQFVSDTGFACDNQQSENYHQTCHGWDEFSDEELAGFCSDLAHEEIRITPGAGAEAPVAP
jgi:hypothetical protein